MALRFDKLCLNSVGYVQVDHCGVAADYYAYLFRTLPRCWFWPGARLRYCKDYRAIELKANAFSSVGGSNKTKLKSLASCLWNIMPCLYVCMYVYLPALLCLSPCPSVCLSVCMYSDSPDVAADFRSALSYANSFIHIALSLIFFNSCCCCCCAATLLRLSLVLFAFIGNKRENGIVFKYGESARERNTTNLLTSDQTVVFFFSFLLFFSFCHFYFPSFRCSGILRRKHDDTLAAASCRSLSLSLFLFSRSPCLLQIS